MKILLVIRDCLPYIGIVRVNHRHGHLISRTIRMIGLLILAYTIATTLWYFVFDAQTFADQTRSLASLDMILYILVVYSIYIGQWHTFQEVLDAIQLQISKRESMSSTTVYLDANDMIEMLSRYASILIFRIVAPAYVIPLVAFSYIGYYVLDSGSSAFLMSFPATYPYNWQTPLNYLATMTVLSIHFYYLAHVYYIKCSLFAGICKFLITFCEDFEQTAHDMEEYIGNGNSFEIKTKFKELIQFHIELMQLAKQCSWSYGSILFAFFYFSGSFWCILLLQLYEFIQTNDFVLLLIVITTTVAFLPFFFLICHVGENVTIAFAKLNVAIYDMPWHMCPVDVQRCIGPTFLASHRPFHFRGIASLKCSHETFKKVINAGYSYFMMLCRIDTA